MSRTLLLMVLMLGLSCQSAEHEDGDEHEIAMSEVPQAAKDAALAAVPGLVIAEAETETENGVRVYCLEGMARGKAYEVEVTADGAVLEIESESESDEDDEDEEEEEDED